nr:ufm1-specific protease 2-like [Leptinotarsa decemlineata]
MKPSIKVAEKLPERISKIKEQCTGKLFGIFQENSIYIISLISDIENGPNLEESLPAELRFCGLFHSCLEPVNQMNPKENVDKHSVLISYEFKTGTMKFSVEENGNFVEANYDIVSEQDISNLFVTIRINGNIPLKSEATQTSIQESFQKIYKSLSLGAIAFRFSKSDIFLLDPQSDNNIIGIDGDIDIGEVCKDSNSFNEESSRKRNISKSTIRILEMDILRPVTKSQNGLIKEHAPLCVLDKIQQEVVDMTIRVDSLAMIPTQTKLSNLYDILLKSVEKYLQLFQTKLCKELLSSNKKSRSLAVETYHFLPPECGHFVTILYPKNETEASLQAYRHLLHRQLLLDFVSPAFRRANKYCFNTDSGNNGPLINPHEGIKPTDNGGTVALVKGKYEYYHYCQKGMDDDGWGCAYRSLQTLASWFKLQGYVDREVPSFSEIQKCLVDIKDKPASFLGSRLWIGSTEVNFVLNTLFGIENKILYVSSGAEMASKGPELLNHFQNHGSPIMIGE